MKKIGSILVLIVLSILSAVILVVFSAFISIGFDSLMEKNTVPNGLAFIIISLVVMCFFTRYGSQLIVLITQYIEQSEKGIRYIVAGSIMLFISIIFLIFCVSEKESGSINYILPILVIVFGIVLAITGRKSSVNKLTDDNDTILENEIPNFDYSSGNQEPQEDQDFMSIKESNTQYSLDSINDLFNDINDIKSDEKKL